jgi:hypothetical protein
MDSTDLSLHKISNKLSTRNFIILPRVFRATESIVIRTTYVKIANGVIRDVGHKRHQGVVFF